MAEHMWHRILGLWLAATGVSLLFSFGWQYRLRFRYAYLGLIGLSLVLWGVGYLREESPIPRWLPWVVFALGLASMFRDSARRYRETREATRPNQATGNRHQATDLDSGPDA